MFRRPGVVVATFGGVVVAIVAVIAYGWFAVGQVMPFYQVALDVAPNDAQAACQEMESRVAALVSDAARQPTWQAVFSDAEINGWLAIAVQEKFPEWTAETVADPRVEFKTGEVQIGYRLHGRRFATVVSVRASATIVDQDVLAVRLRGAQAGTLPIPLGKISDAIAEAARSHQVALRWTQQEGDPVALVSLSGVFSTDTYDRRLNAVEFHEGELFVAGSSEQRKQQVAATPETEIHDAATLK